MTLGKDEALEALDELERTQGRALAFAGYRHAGPFILAWGVAWAAVRALPGPPWRPAAPAGPRTLRHPPPRNESAECASCGPPGRLEPQHA